MALPTQTDLGTLEYVYMGTPFVAITGNTNVNTNTLEYLYMGTPFITAPSTAAPVTYNTAQFFMVF